jgi:hypothetical protein
MQSKFSCRLVPPAFVEVGTPHRLQNPRPRPGISFIRTEALLLLLTFSVSLLALLAGILRMLLCIGRMLFALYVVVLSMLLGRGTMGLGGILVMFRRLIMSVFRHGIPPESVGVI